jgi:hypothetical protein
MRKGSRDPRLQTQIDEIPGVSNETCLGGSPGLGSHRETGSNNSCFFRAETPGPGCCATKRLRSSGMSYSVAARRWVFSNVSGR